MDSDENKLISELDPLSTATNNDTIPIWDESTEEVKKITRVDFLDGAFPEGDIVFTEKEQTLENKTLEAPIINEPVIENATSTGTDDGEETLENKTFIAPIIDNTIFDTNNNESLELPATVNAVNYISIQNSSTGQSTKIESKGSDTNIGINLIPKGTGKVKIDGVTFPKGVGSPGQALSVDGLGNSEWVDISTPSNKYFNATKSLFAEPQSPADETLEILPGWFKLNGDYVNYIGGTTPAFTEPATNDRIDLLGLVSTPSIELDTVSQLVEETDSVHVFANQWLRQTFTVEDADAQYFRIQELRVRMKRGTNTTTRTITATIKDISETTGALSSASITGTYATFPIKIYNNKRFNIGEEIAIDFKTTISNATANGETIFSKSTASTYPGGSLYSSLNNGITWTAQTGDIYFELDIVLFNENDVAIKIIQGNESVTPNKPLIPSQFVPIAYVYNRAGQTSILSEDDSVNGYILNDTRNFIDDGEKEFITELVSDFVVEKTQDVTITDVTVTGGIYSADGINFYGLRSVSSDPQIYHYQAGTTYDPTTLGSELATAEISPSDYQGIFLPLSATEVIFFGALSAGTSIGVTYITRTGTSFTIPALTTSATITANTTIVGARKVGSTSYRVLMVDENTEDIIVQKWDSVGTSMVYDATFGTKKYESTSTVSSLTARFVNDNVVVFGEGGGANYRLVNFSGTPTSVEFIDEAFINTIQTSLGIPPSSSISFNAIVSIDDTHFALNVNEFMFGANNFILTFNWDGTDATFVTATFSSKALEYQIAGRVYKNPTENTHFIINADYTAQKVVFGAYEDAMNSITDTLNLQKLALMSTTTSTIGATQQPCSLEINNDVYVFTPIGGENHGFNKIILQELVVPSGTYEKATFNTIRTSGKVFMAKYGAFYLANN